MNINELRTIIEFGVVNEIEAYEFYMDANKRIKDDNLKNLFMELAEEELEHKKFLEKFLYDYLVGDVQEIVLDEVRDYKLSETLDEPKLSMEMSFPDAVALAIKKEQDAMELYDDLASFCLEQDKRNIFLGLMEMERMHKVRLEEVYMNVAYNEVW